MGNRIGKGKGNDATQDVSLSQFVPPKPPPQLTKPPTISRGSQKNDMSLWGGVVVGTSDFAPAPAKQARSHAWKWIAAAGVVVGAGIGAAVLFLNGADPAPAPPSAPVVSAPVETAPEKPPEPPPAPAPPPENPAVEAPAASVASALPTDVDAISGVAPIIKPKPVAKKKVRKAVKKKASVKKKKR